MDSLSRVIVARLCLWALVLVLALVAGSAFAAGTVPIGGGTPALGWKFKANAIAYGFNGLCSSNPYPKAEQTSISAAVASGKSGSCTGTGSNLSQPAYAPTSDGQSVNIGVADLSHPTYGVVEGLTILAIGRMITPTPTCPANSTDTGGGYCTCAAGYVPGLGSVCEVAATACQGMTATAPNYQYSTTGKPDGTTFCDSSSFCQIKAGFGAQNYSGTGWTMSGPFTATGSDCTPSTASPTAPSAAASAASAPSNGCKPGEVQGTVNGATVCVWSPTTATRDDIAASAPGGAASAPARTVGDGSGGTMGVPAGGSATRMTECVGGTCTTTITVRDSSGNIVGTTSSSYTNTGAGGGVNDGSGSGSGGDGATESFCEANPETTICQSSTFGGACGAAFTCEGDAIQCAIAKDQHVRHCQIFEDTGDLRTIGEAAIARGDTRADDHPNHPDNVTTHTFGSGTFSQTDLLSGSGGCPADATVAVGSGSVVMPWSKVCTPATWLGNLLVAITALACIAIAFKRG
jgi:hypothetical protein